MASKDEGEKRQIIQAGLGTTPDRGIIQSLWLEVPGNCDLACSYCFCATKRGYDDDEGNIAFMVKGDDGSYRRGPNTSPYNAQPYIDLILKPFADRIQEWNEATPEERIARFGCPPENSEGQIRGKIAFPGAGEPLHLNNLELTKQLIEYASGRDLHVTLFTTAHWLVHGKEEEESRQLAEWLLEHDVVLLVKYNSKDEDTQNRFVSNVGEDVPEDQRTVITHYAKLRDEALDVLEEIGFNKPNTADPEQDPLHYQKTRLGIVTSVMKDNYAELVSLLDYARTNNIIFDCDTLLERGRGTRRCPQHVPDNDVRAKFLELQRHDRDEYREEWEVSRSYIGTTCDRFRHHLYVDKRGDIYPCVGCLGEPNEGIQPIKLGKVIDGPQALYDAWNKPLMKEIIRKHAYAGKCATCVNAIEHDCYSCLGRCRDTTVALDPQNETPIPTTGCWNNRPLNELLSMGASIFRSLLDATGGDETDGKPVCRVKALVKEGQLHRLWMPQPARPECAADGSDGARKAETPCWLLKDITLGELREFQSETLEPDCHWDPPSCQCNGSHDPDCCCCNELLPRIFVRPLQGLFESTPGQELLWATVMLFDEKCDPQKTGRAAGSFRTLARMTRKSPEHLVFLLLYRMAEFSYGEDGVFGKLILDLSDLIKKDARGTDYDYSLLLRPGMLPTGADERQDFVLRHLFDISSIIEAVTERGDRLREQLTRKVVLDKDLYDLLSKVNVDRAGSGDGWGADAERARKALERLEKMLLGTSSRRGLGRAASEIFFDPEDQGTEFPEELANAIDVFCCQLRRAMGCVTDDGSNTHDSERQPFALDASEVRKLANYFVWLSALHPKTESYTVRYVANFRVQIDTDNGGHREKALEPSGIVIASKGMPSSNIAATAEVILSYLLGPLNDFYALERAREQGIVTARADVGTGMFHNLRQYLHSLQKYAGALDNVVATSDATRYDDVAAIAGKLTGTLDSAFRFQNAVFRVLRADISVSRLADGDLGDVASVEEQARAALRLVYDGMMGAISMFSSGIAKDWLVGTNDFNAARALLKCRAPKANAWGDRITADVSELADSAERIVNDSAFLRRSTNTMEEIIQAFEVHGVRIDVTGLAADARLPADLCLLVFGELILNAVRASLKMRWLVGGDAFVRIEASKDRVVVANTATPDDVEAAMLPPKRPLGKDSGWGRWATQEMIRLTGWELRPEREDIDGCSAIKVTLAQQKEARHGQAAQHIAP